MGNVVIDEYDEEVLEKNTTVVHGWKVFTCFSPDWTLYLCVECNYRRDLITLTITSTLTITLQRTYIACTIQRLLSDPEKKPCNVVPINAIYPVLWINRHHFFGSVFKYPC